MNKQIELLAKQAGYKHPDAVGTCEDFAYFDMEKFAELIVRECAIHVFNGDPSDGQRLKIGREIKQHFGVKE